MYVQRQCLLLLGTVCAMAFGHGYLVEPPGRASMWRYGYDTPINYNDNQMFCGGSYTQNELNIGKCGICGDPWDGERENEAGGRFATGIISRKYVEGQVVSISVLVTANHMGWFEFKLCPTNNPMKAATHECLNAHALEVVNGHGTKYYITSRTGIFTVDVRLPTTLTCTQCVLQWRWHTGNSWGLSSSGRGCVGCGPQEEFYGCADVSISSNHKLNVVTDAVVPETTTIHTMPTTAKVPPFQTRETISATPEMTSEQRTQSTTAHRPESTTAQIQLPTTSQSPVKTTTQTKQTTIKVSDQTTSRRPEITTSEHAGQTTNHCFAVNNWKGIPVLDKWCQINCSVQKCPPIYCQCP